MFYGDATGATVYYYYGTSGWGTTYGGLPTVELYPFTFTTNSGAVTITGYTGSGGGVAIPDTINGYPVTTIGDGAFAGSALTSVTIPNSVTSIGQQAFNQCTSLRSVMMGNGVTNIGIFAFYYCGSLTNVIIPNSITSIGASAFDYCSSLTSEIIPNSVTSIGSSAFSYCTSLTNTTFLGNAPSLGSIVFNGHPAGATVYYYYGTSGWGATYGGLPAVELGVPFTYTTISGAITITGYNTNAGLNVSIPATINNYPVTVIGTNAFNNSTITNVTIPNSVTSLAPGAFANCTGLKNVIIGSSVANIDDYAFYNSSSLPSVTIPGSVTNIGQFAFQFSGVTNVIIGNGVTTIADYAFNDCYSLANVTFGNSVTSIGQAAFAESVLTSVTLPNSVTSIGGNEFYGCYSLTNVTIGTGLTSIVSGAFQQCYALAGVYFRGNSPAINNDTSVFAGDSSPIAYYSPKTTGWGAIFDGIPTATWNPVIVATNSPMISAGTAKSVGGAFQFSFTGTSGASFTIFSTTNLALPFNQWTNLGAAAESPSGSGQFTFTDPHATNNPSGYYRVRSP